MSSIDNPSWINADDVGGSRSGRVRRKIMIGMVGIAVVALVAAVAVTARGDTPRWRTALVGRHDVITSLSGVGTVEAVSQAAVAFPISGTVASVDVTEGQSVGVGQTLASLATTSLQQSLDEAQATATQAALALTQATTTTAAVPSSTASPTTSTSDTGATASGSDQRASGESGTNPALASAQSDLLHAQHEADARL
ncbi:MAG: biotin/lipoyl-binding protein, partial [Actinobacteria bacterium]|nr:biotin/lipoyl-binding protein [Actinomycetota bacterium]